MSKSKDKLIILYSLAIIPVMLANFKNAGRAFDLPMSYFFPYGVYLFVLIMGIIAFHGSWKPCQASTCQHRWVYYIMSFVPPICIFFIAFLPIATSLSIKLIAITVLYAIINGTLEECFWRLSFNRVFPQNAMFAFVIPTIIFIGWHTALLFAKGMSYTGGAPSLLGGAAIMGVLWGLTMYKTGNIRIVIAAHILVNFFAFAQLLYVNGLVA